MAYIRSVVTRYRYAILVSSSLLIAIEMGLAFGVDVPIEYEGLLGWLLFLTILTWVIVGWVVGYVAPMSVEDRAIKRSYRILVSCPFLLLVIIAALIISWGFEGIHFWRLSFAIIAWAGITALFRAVTSKVRTKMRLYAVPVLIVFLLLAIVGEGGILEWLLSRISIFILIAPLAWVGMSGILSLLSPDIRYIKGYAFVVVSPLVLFACIGILTLFFISLYYSKPWLLLLMLFAMLITWLGVIVMGTPITSVRPVSGLVDRIVSRYRNILVAAIVLWALISITGWYWAATMSNGIDASFTEQEYRTAQNAFGTICDNPLDPTGYRVIKSSGSGFYVQGFTWWGIPTDVKCYYR